MPFRGGRVDCVGVERDALIRSHAHNLEALIAEQAVHAKRPMHTKDFLTLTSSTEPQALLLLQMPRPVRHSEIAALAHTCHHAATRTSPD